VLRVREDAIISAVNRLLADKGFDLMTVDEVAADVGIAKASLYKHFASKEALASAAMVRVLERAGEVIAQQAAREASARERLIEVTRWVLQMHLAGQMPTLPSQNSTLRAELLGHKRYLELLLQVSEQLGGWIVQAQADGAIDRSLPPELVLYTLYARACDPVPLVLKAGGRYAQEEIIEFVLRTCFSGLAGRPS
jgi:AcrR family transcriptional regulator